MEGLKGFSRGRYPRSNRLEETYVLCQSLQKPGPMTAGPRALVNYPFFQPGKLMHFAVSLQKRLSIRKCEGQNTSDGPSSKVHFTPESGHVRFLPWVLAGAGRGAGLWGEPLPGGFSAAASRKRRASTSNLQGVCLLPSVNRGINSATLSFRNCSSSVSQKTDTFPHTAYRARSGIVPERFTGVTDQVQGEVGGTS